MMEDLLLNLAGNVALLRKDYLQYVVRIQTPDVKAMAEARRRQDVLTKPRGSLGKLEDLSIRLAGIYRTSTPRIGRKTIFTMAGDHGVTEEGVSAYPSEVTAQMVLNFARRGAAINVLGAHVGATVKVVDMGVSSDMNWPEGIVKVKIAKGTKNMSKGPAMTHDQALASIEAGARLAIAEAKSGVNALAIGDMGIGNTTAASAITAVITNKPINDVTGRGTGIDDKVLNEKVRVILQAIRVNSPNPHDGVDVLSKVGGLEIAGMTGVILGAASEGVPVFLDGFVSSSSALIANLIAPNSKDYMIASHLSVEPGHVAALEHLRLDPVLDMRMRLGEGTGAALAFFIADAACKILNEMATFESAGVSRQSKEDSR